MHALDRVTTFTAVLHRQGSMTEAEIENLLSKSGRIAASASEAEGEGRAARAAQAATVPLLGSGPLGQALGIMVEVASGDYLIESEINTAADAVRHVAGPETEMLIWDLRDEKMGDAVRVTVIMIETGVST